MDYKVEVMGINFLWKSERKFEKKNLMVNSWIIT